MQQLEFVDAVELRSSWRCARCKHGPAQPIIKWLWRNNLYGTALMKCAKCKWEWQEPGWQNIDGGWVDMTYQQFGIGDGYAVWSRSTTACLGEAEESSNE